MRLDERLSLALEMYKPCPLGADIGTDHAYLPLALLREGKCQRMILTDISRSALENGRNHLIAAGMLERVELRQGDGLQPIREACGMISILGMGGKTIRQILTGGRERLRGAELLLSAHTDLPEVRRGVMEIGYHLVREVPCRAAGRFYLMMRAAPGAEEMTEREIRLGKRLYDESGENLRPWLLHQAEVLRARERGLRSTENPQEALLLQTEEDRAYLEERAEKNG